MVINTHRLGLAAFMKMKGCTLLRFENRRFFFETDRDLTEWEIDYSNSCCYRHDLELCELRKLYPSSPRG